MRTLPKLYWLFGITQLAICQVTLSTAAGTGSPGYDGETGMPGGGAVAFAGVGGIARDAAGNWIVSDTYNQRIRQLTPDFSSARTLTGTGASIGRQLGVPLTRPALEQPLIDPAGVAVAPNGTIFFYDQHTIRRYDPGSRTVTLIGGLGVSLASPAPSTEAFSTYVVSIALHPDGRIFYTIPNITDVNQGRVRVIENGVTRDLTPNRSVLAFKGEFLVMTLFADGSRMYAADEESKRLYRIDLASGARQEVASLAAAGLVRPSALANDGAGTVFLADAGAHKVLRIPLDGGPPAVIAGAGAAGSGGLGGPATAAQLNEPMSLYYDTPSKRLYIGERAGARLLYLETDGRLLLAAGTGRAQFSGDDQPAPATAVQSRVANPSGLAAGADGSIYMCEPTSYRIRRLTPAGGLTAVAGNGFPRASADQQLAVNASLLGCRGLTLDPAGNVFYYDGDSRIKRIDAATGRISTFAGGGAVRFATGHGSLAADRQGNIYIADTAANVIRRITPAGQITTVAGTGQTNGDFQATGPGTSIVTSGPWATAMAPNGTLYFSTDQSVIRALAPDGTVRHIGGSTARGAAAGDGGPARQATFERIEALAADSEGRVYVAHGSQVRVIGTDGIVTRFTGGATAGFAGDGGPPAGGQLSGPVGLAAGPDGSLFISDAGNNRIRRAGLPQAASLSIVSGDSQTLDFDERSQPLVVEARTAANTPAARAAVSFSHLTERVRTDAQGRASSTVTAGREAARGRITAASAGAPSVTFQYSVTAPLAIVSATNAFDQSASFAPGSLIAVQLANLKTASAAAVTFLANGTPAMPSSNMGGPVDTVLVALPATLDAGAVRLEAEEPGRAAKGFTDLSLANTAPVLQRAEGGAPAFRIDQSLVTAEAPAAPGALVTILLTGAGKVDDAANPEAMPLAPAQVSVDGTEATIDSFRMRSPGIAALSFRVPEAVGAGVKESAVRISVGEGVASATLWTGQL